jgi:penicillin amidase
MSGRLYNRPSGISGLIPLPGWEKKYDPDGYVEKEKLPSQYNPEDGIIVTANQDLNHLGDSNPINLPMGIYRADRIRQLLLQKENLDISHMKAMHYDLYSLQAENFMEIIRPLLPDTENGNILKEWDHKYDADSKGAMLFESIYLSLIYTVFGENGLGKDVVDFIFKETPLFNDYYANLDRILMQESSVWFSGQTRESIYRKAIDKGLNVQAKPYGETRTVMLSHLLFGGQLPGFFGYDYGPLALPGNRATIPQGQIFQSAGRTTTFSPCYRFIADMAYQELHTNMPGGPTDRRFSKWYTSDMENWKKGIYKVLG